MQPYYVKSRSRMTSVASDAEALRHSRCERAGMANPQDTRRAAHGSRRAAWLKLLAFVLIVAALVASRWVAKA
jgi:hypothetical protein